jgi:hypothetical protein
MNGIRFFLDIPVISRKIHYHTKTQVNASFIFSITAICFIMAYYFLFYIMP